MTVALIRIEAWLRAHSLPTAESLYPPATIGLIDRVSKVLTANMPADLSRLYLWHDGADSTKRPFEVAPSLFLPLNSAIEAWQYRNQLYAPYLADDPDFATGERTGSRSAMTRAATML